MSEQSQTTTQPYRFARIRQGLGRLASDVEVTAGSEDEAREKAKAICLRDTGEPELCRGDVYVLEATRVTAIRTTQHYTTQWTAIDEATYDGPGSPVGYGRTEQEAIDDLKEQVNNA